MKTDVVDDIAERIQERLKLTVREIDNQKSRAMNLIVFNLSESECDDSEDRIREDKAMFEEICASIGVQKVEMHSAFRLGKRQPNKIRPLNVTLTNRKQRKDIIDNAREIGTKAPYPYRKVIIFKDLTPRQRVENKQRIMIKKSASTQKKKSPEKSSQAVHANSSPMDHGTSSHYNAYHEQTVMNTIESNDETVIGGLSQGDDVAKLRALYPTEKGESPI